MNGPQGTYGRIARWVLGHRLAVSVGALLLAVASALLGIPPDIDSNLLNLLPADDPVVGRLRQINSEEGGLNLLTLTYRAEDPAVLDPFLDTLAARFEAFDDVAFAVHELDPDLATEIGLLQLEPAEIRELNVRLQGALALGAAGGPLVSQRLMDMGPLTEKIEKAGKAGVLATGEAGVGRLIVRPTRTSADPVFAQLFMKQTYALLDELEPAARAQGIEREWMGGAYRHNVEDVEGIRADLVRTAGLSAGLILLVMVLSFRSLRALLIVFPPLVLANLMTLAFTKQLIGALNTYTSFATAILFGLGIDFAIHLVGRYREHRAQGLEQPEAIVRAWDQTGPPCGTAAFTSAAGFLALTFAEFVGFAQLGVILAFGLMACLGCMVFLLPVLLTALDTQTAPLLGASDGVARRSGATYALSPTGLGVVVVATIAVGVFALPRLSYEYDVSNLRREGLAYSELSDTERKLARQSYSPIVVFYDGEPEQLATDQHRLEQLVDAGGMPHVAAAVSIANVLPPDQADRLERIGELVELSEHKNLRYLPPVIAQRLVGLRGLEVRPLTRADLPEALLLLLGANNPNAPRMLLLPKGNMWDVREVAELDGEIARALPGRPVTGEYLGIQRMFTMAFRDAPRIAGIALLLVFLLAWWDLKRPLLTLGAVGTLLAGMIWAGGALWLGGVKLTMVNLTGIPILLGLGVDVVVHLLHRLQEEGPGGIRRALRTTGVAAGLSTLTTIASFFSLTLAGSRAVQSLGTLVVVGLGVIFVAGATVLPLAWSAGWKLAGLAPADQPVEPEEEVAPNDA
ncbi:MAG: MMPL family transporter [Alphaproteobacteria bacterium]|nr:MMPL family transporter [Alphaproteobacteria bacterium]